MRWPGWDADLVNAWTVPEAWPGETFFILGGGPSLQGFPAEVLRGRGRVIAVNEAGLAVAPEDADAKPRAPWADVLYWADRRFFEWNHHRLASHQGAYKVARYQPDKPTGLDIKVLPQSDADLATDRRSLSGFCGGGAAINLAFLLGAKRIVLLGYDMKGANWHTRHRRTIDESRYRTHFMPPIARMAWPLKQRGVEVINCTPGSAMTCFPFGKLEDLLQTDKLLTVTSDVASNRVELPAEGWIFEHRGLELVPRRELNRQIARLSVHLRARVVIRLQGGDVVTQRSADWWQLQLSLAFPQVVIESETHREVVFACRKTPAAGR